MSIGFKGLKVITTLLIHVLFNVLIVLKVCLYIFCKHIEYSWLSFRNFLQYNF
jgi:hypothetical protein